MKPTRDEELMARWLDGEMSDAERAEFEARLAADPDLRDEATGLQSLRVTLQTAFPKHDEVPHADFFNHRIHEHVLQSRREAQSLATAGRPFLRWFRGPWFAVGAAAACALVVFALWPAEAPATAVLTTYAPNYSVHASTFHSKDAQATVLMLDGLEAMPADHAVSGVSVHHSQTDGKVATTTLFSKSGGVLLVLATDTSNTPHIISH